MARYLVVAHQTAGSPELVERVRALAASDPAAEFVLLIPATPVHHLLHTWEEVEARQLAWQRGQEAAKTLTETGARIDAVRVGAPYPLDAVADELRDHDDYAAIVLSTFPPGLSRWLKGNLPGQLHRRHRLQVIHVVASSAAQAAAGTAGTATTPGTPTAP
jgi:hypothetical protein